MYTSLSIFIFLSLKYLLQKSNRKCCSKCLSCYYTWSGFSLRGYHIKSKSLITHILFGCFICSWAVGVLEGLQLAKLKGFPKVELQIDSQAAVMSIKGRNVGSSNGRRLITTIRKLMADFEGTRVVHIYQDVNMCTDALTNTAYDSEVDFVMFNQPPVCLTRHIRLNVLMF